MYYMHLGDQIAPTEQHASSRTTTERWQVIEVAKKQKLQKSAKRTET